MVFPYRQNFVCSNPEFRLKFDYQNINLRITVHNSKSSIVTFSRNIQLLISTFIVIIDQAFGVIHHFRCNHIPSLNFAMILVSPNSCAIFLTFWVTANVSYLWSFSSQSSSPQKKQFGVKFRKSTLLQLTRTSIGSDSEDLQVHHEYWTIQRVSVFDSTSAFYILLHKICETLCDSL